MKGIENYSPEWPKKYEIESEKIKSVFGDEVIDIQHIGSTSIPGAIAKPLIDIGILTNSIDDIDSFVKKLEPLGYSYKPDMSSVERILSTTRLRNNVIDIKLLLFTALVDANNPDDEVWIADCCVEYGSHEVYVFGLQAAVLTSTSRHTGSSMIAPNQLS
jgi:GrpB-like predicted nucleotidyltransferase (UPF0157 family)